MAVKRQSWAPVATAGINLALGIAAFPLIAWLFTVIVWALSTFWMVRTWVREALSRFFDTTVFTYVLWGILGIILLLLSTWLLSNWSSIVKFFLGAPAILWGVVVGLVATIILGWMARDVLLVLFTGATAYTSPAFAIVKGIALSAWSFAIAGIGWVIGLLVLAQFGGTTFSPLRGAFKMHHNADHLGDVAAGLGIAISTILMASSYVIPGSNFSSIQERVSEIFWQHDMGTAASYIFVDLKWLMPDVTNGFMEHLFGEFNPTPDLLFVVIACVISSWNIFRYQRAYSPESGDRVVISSIVTLAITHVALSIVLIVCQLAMTTSSR